MSRFVTLMIGLGLLTAAIGGVMLVSSPSPAPTGPATENTKPIGSSTLSHGGPSPALAPAPEQSPIRPTMSVQDLVGQDVVVTGGGVELYRLPIDLELHQGGHPIKSGTRVHVLSLAMNDPTSLAQSSPVVNVRLPDGTTGWVDANTLIGDIRQLSREGKEPFMGEAQ
mgnify:CR=1 FL=1